MTDNNVQFEHIASFLLKEGLAGDADNIRLTPLSGDGSSRRFYNVRTESASFCAVLPAGDSDRGLSEAQATFNIGTHLKKRGIPVPKIHAFDPDSGLIIFEDLGTTLLHDHIAGQNENSAAHFSRDTVDLYSEIIEILLYMQISGSIRFNRKWCWDTQKFDKKLMLAKESGYFMQAFCTDLLGLSDLPDGLADEFKLLASRAARQPAVYFLHRDFQSRNIMLHDGKIRIIDFQGGRLGPLGYDLASLLIDPYANIPEEFQQLLFEHYLEHLCKYGLDDLAFAKGYSNLALQRNLQILGAFAFLGFRKQKSFFRTFIPPAALSLQQRLTMPESKDYPLLRQLVEQVLELLDQKKDLFYAASE